MKILISFTIIVILFNGCLTPYDNEFTCKPRAIGKCSTSIIKSYDETLNKIEKKDKNYEEIN
jgi:hypothetical protein